MAVVKADAYGHGFLQVARTLLENGADAFAVAMLEEAKQLRSRGIDVPVLILGNTNRDLCEDLIDYGVMPTVFRMTWQRHCRIWRSKKIRMQNYTSNSTRA